MLGGKDGTGACAAVAVEGFERDAPADPEPDRGRELVELLPFEIMFEGAEYSIGELRRASVGTIISLDAPYPRGAGRDALPSVRLVVAGKPAGAGKAVVVGERFGIELDECLPPSKTTDDPRVTGSILKPGASRDPGTKPKLYDWRRPDCFSKRQLDSIGEIHERAASTLDALLPELGGIELKMVDQLTYGELVESLPERVRILSADLGGGRRAYGREAEAEKPSRPLIVPASPRVGIPEDAVAAIDAWNGVKETTGEKRPLIVFAEGAGSEGAATIADHGAELLRGLRSAWKSVADLPFDAAREEAEPPVIRANGSRFEGTERGIAEREMICYVECRCPGGLVGIVYPMRSLAPVWGLLERHGR